MNRGTAWVGFDPNSCLLGIDYSPSWSRSLSMLGDVVRSSADQPTSLFDGPEPVYLDPDDRQWFMKAHYALDNGVRLPKDTAKALNNLVGLLTMEVLPDRGVMVQVHSGQTSVLALHALEMDLEVRNRPDLRHCVVCGTLLQRHGNAVACEGECSRQRKRQNDRERYRRKNAPLR